MSGRSKIETVREGYRPNCIKTLFVGESAPASGDFFYCGGNAMLTHMRCAVEPALGGSGGSDQDFLERFKKYGWFLDDLVLTPVNHLTKSERKAKCLEAQRSLADRIAAYQPEAIVSLLIFTKPFVDEAAILLGWRGYFGFCQTPRVLTNLEAWIRRRLRMYLWRQWSNGVCRTLPRHEPPRALPGRYGMHYPKLPRLI